MKKILIGGVGLVLIVIVAAGIFLYSSLDSIVKAAVEKYGTEILGVSVRLASVKIDPADGTGTLKGFFIGNPKPFQKDSAFTLGEFSLGIDLSSLTEDVIVIKEINIENPAINFEMDKKGSNNFQSIQNNVNRYMSANSSPDSGGSTKPSSESSSGGSKKSSTKGEKKLIIDSFYLKEANVNLSLEHLKGKDISGTIPTIHLKNIGRKSNGATAAEVSNIVLERLKSAIKNVAKDAIRNQLENLAKEKLNEVKAKARAELEKKKSELKEKAKSEVDEKLKGELKGKLKGLF